MNNMRCAPVVVEPVEGAVAGGELTQLMALVMRASTGPMDVRETSPRRHAVTRRGRFIGSFRRRDDALLFANAGDALEQLIGGVGTILARHHDDGHGRCAECGHPADCDTRRAVAGVLSAPGER